MSSSKPISLAEVLGFQAKVIDPLLANSKIASLLKQDQWMGCNGSGDNWTSLPKAEAETLVQLLGVGAFKIVRFTPQLLAVLQKALADGRPIVSAGGSCLVTAADNSQWRKAKVPFTNLTTNIETLPNLMQVTDASIPITVANQYLNIIEDSLFAQFGSVYADVNGQENILLAAFQAEGLRHSKYFDKWQKMLGSLTIFTPTNFSSLPIKEHSDNFWMQQAAWQALRQTGLRAQEAKEMTRAQVMFSFTGLWAQMLRETGLIPTDSCYLTVEPFHHFTETHNVSSMGAIDTLLFKLNRAFDLLMRANPYGHGINSGIQGGIAFLPTLSADGCLGHCTLTTEQLPTRFNYQSEIARRKQLLEIDKVPCLTDNELFFDGLNYLYHIPECRQALIILSELWYSILEDGKKIKDKDEAKNKRKLLRGDAKNVQTVKEQHSIILDHFKQLLINLFSK